MVVVAVDEPAVFDPQLAFEGTQALRRPHGYAWVTSRQAPAAPAC
jgi:hypothetical protein